MKQHRVMTLWLALLLGAGCGATEEHAPGRGSAARTSETAKARHRASAAASEHAATAPSSATPAPDEELVVAVRMHILRSADVEMLNSDMTEAEARDLVAGVNEAWKQARVRFELERVVTEQATHTAEYAAIASEAEGDRHKGKDDRDYKRRKIEARDATCPDDQRIPKGIDVYVHRSLVAAGGVFSCGKRAVLFAEYGSGRKKAKSVAKVLAHELGHALDLPHAGCEKAGNLMMAGGCPDADREGIGLDAEQIATARRTAATGNPQTCKAGDDTED